MKLIELKITEETEEFTLFKIKVETTSLFSNSKIKSYDCFKSKEKYSKSKFVSNGKSLFEKWLEIDYSINAILSTNTKEYLSKQI